MPQKTNEQVEEEIIQEPEIKGVEEIHATPMETEEIDTTDRRIRQRDVIGGFTVLKDAPTDDWGEEGQIVLRDDEGGPSTFKLYAKIKGSWKSVTLT